MEKNSKLHIGWLVTAMMVVLWLSIRLSSCTSRPILPWRVCSCYRLVFIEFIENNGMAWGMTFIGKFWLSMLRLTAICVLLWYLCHIIKSGKHRKLYIILVALVTTGAIGNIIDSMFYGLIFTAASPYYVSYQVPFGEGYAPFLMGKVVDMFRFPFFSYTWPEWVPFLGGQHGVFLILFSIWLMPVSLSVLSLCFFSAVRNWKVWEMERRKLSLLIKNRT